MTPIEAYQAGLLDAVRGRPPLTVILSAAGETALLVEYGRGQIAGSELLETEK